MLNEKDLKVLKVMSSNLLLTKSEITRQLSEDGFEETNEVLMKLKDMDLVKRVESIGTSFVITSKGLKALKKD